MAQPERESRCELLPAREVARRLSISIRTLRRLVQGGTLPQPIRLSRKLIRWRTTDIERYLKRLEDLAG